MITRREFTKAAAGSVAAASMPWWCGSADAGDAGPETLTKELYRSLSDSQRAAVCLPADSPLRTRVNANWDVTKPAIGDDFYSPAQRELIREVVRGVTSGDGHDRLTRQMDEDSGGLETYTVALFGRPGGGDFQFVLTGRHLTLRCDGDREDGVAFGGPLVYGHGEEDAAANIFHYQTKAANEVFAALDAGQRKAALRKQPPKETAVKHRAAGFPGLRVGDMTEDQRQLVSDTLKVVLAPYREADVEEAHAALTKGGGLDDLRMAFYRQGDLGGDGVWDVWRIEGPTFVCHFRGAPHVHAYLNVAARA